MSKWLYSWQTVWVPEFPADGCKYARKATVQLVACYVGSALIDGTTISPEIIAEITGLNKQTVQHALNHLVKVGVLRKGGFSKYEWVFVLNSQEDGNPNGVPPLRLRTRRPLKN
jgi:hypothetical protein